MSVEEYGTNLDNLIGLCKQKFSTVVIVTLPPQDEVRWDEHSRTTKNIPGCLSNEHASQYADKCLEVAKKNSIECIDLYHDMVRTPDWKELFFCDGLHFSVAGSKFLCERLQHVLDPILLHLPMVYPDWLQVDPVNPENSFK